MTIDDVMQWISNKNVELWQAMQAAGADDKKWMKLKGAYDILEVLRLHILTVTNPHNREDVKKHNHKKQLTEAEATALWNNRPASEVLHDAMEGEWK